MKYEPRLSRLVVLLAGLALSGCETPQRRANEEASARWNQARADVKARLAAEQLEVGNFEAAAGELAVAYELDPGNPRLVHLHARVLLAQGELGAAQRVLESACRSDDADAEMHYLLGIVYQQQERWRDALVKYRAACAQDEAGIAYMVAAVQALLQLDNIDEARAFLSRYRERSGWTSAYQAALAECHERAGDWPASATAWQRVVYSDGADAGLRERLAQAIFRAGRHSEALPILTETVDALRPNVPVRLRLMQAECYLALGRTDDAQNAARFVLARDPRQVAALRLLCRAMVQEGATDTALRVAQRAESLAPRDLVTLELVAGLAWRSGDRDLARTTARKIIGLDPINPIAGRILEGGVTSGK